MRRRRIWDGALCVQLGIGSVATEQYAVWQSDPTWPVECAPVDDRPMALRSGGMRKQEGGTSLGHV